MTFAPTGATLVCDCPVGKKCIVICPGGAYRYVSPREAAPVAQRFAEAGWTPFILTYSTGENLRSRPLTEAAWAVRTVKEKSPGAFVAVCGFSAGGHLAGSIGTRWDDETVFPDAETRAANRPDALVLSYPVISSGPCRHEESFQRLTGGDGTPDAATFSLDKQVSEKTPPAFLWHTAEDEMVPVENSLLFATAMWAENRPCELHIFPHGVHGLSTATPDVDDPENHRFADPHVAKWLPLCTDWLDTLAK